MSFMGAISVAGLLKNFFGPLLLPIGGAVAGLVVTLLLSPSSSSRFGTPSTDTIQTIRVSVPLGFLLGAAASAFFFGWMSLGVPAVVALAFGLKVFIAKRRRKREGQ
jgi:cobalamin synthase